MVEEEEVVKEKDELKVEEEEVKEQEVEDRRKMSTLNHEIV